MWKLLGAAILAATLTTAAGAAEPAPKPAAEAAQPAADAAKPAAKAAKKAPVTKAGARKTDAKRAPIKYEGC